MTLPTSNNSTAAVPVTTDIRAELASAAESWRKLRRAGRVASADAWTLAVLGGLSLVCGISGGVVGVLAGLCLCTAGGFEFHAAARLRRLDPRAPRRLAVIQLCVLGGVLLYCGNEAATTHATNIVAKLSSLGLDGVDQDQADTLRSMLLMGYGLVAVASLLMQGLSAIYYFSRRPLLAEYVRLTPDWILQMQRDRGSFAL